MTNADTASRSYVRVDGSEIEREIGEADQARPSDTAGDSLPFGQMSGGRFELLTYLLLRADHRDDSVTLVKASGDRGRDVLVYQNGNLFRLVQCKNLGTALTEPALVRELLKISLHDHIGKDILPRHPSAGKVEVDIWAPAGFSEPACEMIDEWPRKWTAERVSEEFPETKEAYARFSSLAWRDVCDAVLNDFPLRVTVRKTTGPDISMLVRRNSDVYSQFFRGTVVAPLEQVRTLLLNIVQSGDLRQITDDDLRSLLDRFKEFRQSTRLPFGQAYLMGLSPAYLAKLQPNEMAQVLEAVILPAARISHAVMESTQRIITDYLLSRRAELGKLRNESLPMFVSQYCLERVLIALRKRGVPPALWTDIGLPADVGKFEDELARIARKNWDGFLQIVSPTFKHPTTDPATESLRREIAVAAMRDFVSGDEYISTAIADYRNKHSIIDECVAYIHALVPTDILVISEYASPFNDQDRLRKLVDTVRSIDLAKAAKPRTAPAGSP